MLSSCAFKPANTFNSDYVPLVNLIGLVYQIRDDYCNLRNDEVSVLLVAILCSLSNQYSNTKGFAEDLTEGKFSFPVVHAINADKSNEELLGASL